MTSTMSYPKTIDATSIKHLAGCPGPCITMLLPAHHPGVPGSSRQASLRRLLRTVEEDLVARNFAGHAAQLLAPFKNWTVSETESGGPGIAIFRSPQVLARYSSPAITTEKAIVGDYFHLTPLLASALIPHEFFVLDINRKNLRLIHSVDGECTPMPLPPSVPANMEAAGDIAKHSHDLANRSASGDRQAEHFGLLSERDAAGDYQRHFFAQVDRALGELLAGAPLLLAGVHEEIAAYRRVAAYPHLLNAEIRGNTEFWPVERVEAMAMEAARADYYVLGERMLQRFAEMTDRSRVLFGVHEVFEAAAQGRIHQLCAAEGAEDPSDNNERSEDLVNAAAAETLRWGGEVFMAPPDRMEYSGPVSAILRY